MGTLYNDALYTIGAVINVNKKTPTTYKELWAIIIDTGAEVSVCPITFCEHVSITPMTGETRKQYVTMTRRRTIHIGDMPYIEQFGHSEQLLHIGSHLHVASMVLPGFHTPNEIQVDNTVNTRHSSMDSTTLI
eukprot:6491577-Amphidinium_carterae.1